jgi:thymidine phosphorylase
MISSGAALRKFRDGIRLQGGDERVVDEPDRLPAARFHIDVVSEVQGFVIGTDCQQFGIALAMLGGGRERKEDSIDHGVGLEFHKRIGDRVEKGERLVSIHYNASERLDDAKKRIARSFVMGETAPSGKRPLIRKVIGASGAEFTKSVGAVQQT